ncbi:hypothetical protein [Paenibacillus sp. An7]|uniref:hypothetical protein n=1 Tax=Paenibacillus sp. An7 TaxID=2689577 RepID=UPI00135694AB|nr:hypothetical protein [Paenibacillus sp. An7]
MSYYHVSEENLNKVESFFVRRVKETGSDHIEATVVEIAEGSEVALATAHKAIKELTEQKVLSVIKPKSRRFAITYIYKRDIEEFITEQREQSQIEYLTNLVQIQKEEIKMLRTELNKINGECNIMANILKKHQA